MQSPKNSTKHALVTHESDISDEEIEVINYIQSTGLGNSNHQSELRSMDISPTTNDSKSLHSNEITTPKEKQNTDFTVVIPKKRKIKDNFGGLVSYAMDENDDYDDDYDDDNDENNHNSSDDSHPKSIYKDLSNEYSDYSQNINHNIDEIYGFNNEEFFNTEGRESDIENHESVTIKLNGEYRSESHFSGVDLKTMSGQSSSTVKATVLTNRPKGIELAYSLSRKIYANRHAEIQLQSLTAIKPPVEHEKRIKELRAKSKRSPWNITQAILNNKEYRNPSIYEKLIEHMKIDERGTNYPPELYDPYRFTKESYYEELARAQDEAERKRLHQGKNGVQISVNKPATTNLYQGPIEDSGRIPKN